MEEKNQSNYDRVVETWRKKFLDMDQEKIIRKFHLESDETSLYVTYFSNTLRIDRQTGVITFEGGKLSGESPGFNTSVTIYNMFHYSTEAPEASEKLVPFREVKRVYPFERAYQNTIIQKLQDTFSGHVNELKKACESLGGVRMSQGDAGYILPVFPFLKIAVLFWDGDEEFQAQANMLFDSNITDFMHEENVVGVASDAVYYLTLAAELGAEEIYGGK